MRTLCKDGLRSTSGRLLPKGYGLATTRWEWGRPALDLWSLATERLRVGDDTSGMGTQERPEAISPGHRPGYTASAANALQGQPMEQREQCEHAQTLPSRDRGRQSQKHFAE